MYVNHPNAHRRAAAFHLDFDGVFTLEVDAAELAKQREKWSPPAPRYTTGVLAKCAKLVSSASEGAITG